MKVTIIFPPHKKLHRPGKIYEPLILPYLAAITPSPWKVEIINACKEPLDFSVPTDLVAISFMTSTAPEAYRIAGEYRSRGVKVVMGGYHVTAMPQEAIQYADALCLGEGDLTWPRILADFERGQMKKYYVGGHLSGPMSVQGLPPEDTYYETQQVDLAKIPLPRRDLLKNKYFFNTVVTTRGCPFNCAFCTVTNFYGSQPRHRSAEAVAEEVKQLGPFWLLADDDIFSDSPYRLDLYSRLAQRKKFQQWHGAGSIGAIAKDPNADEMLKLAAKSGLAMLMMGLESAEPDTLRYTRAEGKLRKDDTVDFAWIKENIDRIRSHGISVLGFFMFGFDNENPETINRTLEYCDQLNIFPLPMHFAPLPGSALWVEYKDRLREGFTWDQWDTDTALYHHPTLSPREREQLLNRLRVSAYTWQRIFRRLRGLPIGTQIFSFIMQAGFRFEFRHVAKKMALAK